MLAKKYKLPVQSFAKKRPVFSRRCEFFGVKAAPNSLAFSRFGAVISRKVFPSAVKRNKLKRLFFRVVKKENLHLKDGMDILFIFYPSAANALPEEIEARIKKFARLFFEKKFF